ncbi:MAG: YfhO family protein [Oscillospiraceae bacterium]|nr:YfhO family protein [Oscillospiraceae bacterium]
MIATKPKLHHIFRYTVKDTNYLKVFAIAIVTAVVVFAPFVIFNRGIFLFYGDYNVQQIPFWQLCHEAVRSGNVFWNFNTDLGSPFIGSYSFYVIGSPFFWLTLPFPNDWIPYIMAPLFVLKFTTAAVLAYAYIKRFVKNRDWAVIGAILYAFSAFNIHNVFFNHFIDVAAVFPLALIAMEEFIVNKRRGAFAVSVAVCALTNYFFFIGQVVFLVAYFIMRCFSPDSKFRLKYFVLLAAEAVIGVMLAAFMLLPSFAILTGNYRTEDFLLGQDILMYDRIQRYAHIIQSAFMVPDMPSSKNFFPESGSQWASIAAYLPLFGMAGVIAFLKDRKRHWLRRLLIICMVTAFIPVLNSLFFALNWSYYARWFYMPVLLMALATAMSLDARKPSFESGYKWCIGFILAFTAVIFIPANENGRLQFFRLHETPPLAFAAVIIALGSAAAGLILFRKFRSIPNAHGKATLAATLVCVLICSYFQIGQGLPNVFSNFEFERDNHAYREIVTDGLEMAKEIAFNEFPDPKQNFYRIDVENDSVNQPMLWGIPTIRAFHSVVSASIMNFYPQVTVQRDVSSDPDLKLYGLRGLFSVKYLFTEEEAELENELPGFKKTQTIGNFDIYENEYFIPPGFTFDYYIETEDFENTLEADRHLVLNKALVLTPEQVEKYPEHITAHPSLNDPDLEDFSAYRTTGLDQTFEDEYKQDCEHAQSQASHEFTTDNYGFTAKIYLDSPKLVFFSVPFDKGWSAQVNGKEVEIEKVNSGFMAVAVSTGNNEIRFLYTPSGLYPGLKISGAALLMLVVYVFVFRRKREAELE